MKDIVSIFTEFPIVLFVMFLIFRFMGNKEINQSTPLDFAFMVLLTSIAWDLTISQAQPFWVTLVLMIFLVILIYLFDWMSYKSKTAEKIIFGEPILLIKNGQIQEEALKKERLSPAELRARLRVKGFFSIDEIEACYLEYTGEISVKKKGES